MKNFLLLVLFLPFIGLSQSNKIQAGISTKDSAKLSSLGVYQDDFPNISVVFRAEKKNGNPVFGLSKKDLTVLENEEECQVISIRELSKQKPINIGIVLDHSGSMDYDEVQLQRLGIDMFDCVMPTRNGRNGMLFTAFGSINIKNKKWADDFSEIDSRVDTWHEFNPYH